jgi:hypothetical protein
MNFWNVLHNFIEYLNRVHYQKNPLQHKKWSTMTYNYPLARILHIKPKHESRNFPLTSILVKKPIYKPKSIFSTFYGKITHKVEME